MFTWVNSNAWCIFFEVCEVLNHFHWSYFYNLKYFHYMKTFLLCSLFFFKFFIWFCSHRTDIFFVFVLILEVFLSLLVIFSFSRLHRQISVRGKRLASSKFFILTTILDCSFRFGTVFAKLSFPCFILFVWISCMWKVHFSVVLNWFSLIMSTSHAILKPALVTKAYSVYT